MEPNRYPAQLPPTPLVPVRMAPEDPVVWAKLDYLNPSGSTKDRIARYILTKAVDEGRVAPGGTVIEASSGSTSIAMALVCAQLGLRFIAVMPEGVSNERVWIIRAYGGRIHLTAKDGGVRGSIKESERLAAELGAYLPRQFSNPENAEAHRVGTAREILEQIPGGRVDAVVSGVGTGGTLVGLYQGCRERNGAVLGVLARPVDITRTREEECCGFSCRVPGVIDCISTIFDPRQFAQYDALEVEGTEAVEATRRLIALGFPVGPSSGLNYLGAVRTARRMGPGAAVVTVFPDRMERYFSGELFTPFRS